MPDDWGVLAFMLVATLVTADNLRRLRGTEVVPRPARWPLVSVLVPCRNEENNIGACVRSLLAQNYPNFEVLVVDQSDDRTREALAAISSPIFRWWPGRPRPAGMGGKNWACAQLAAAARGEYLVFVDADVRWGPGALPLIAAHLAAGPGMISFLPRQLAGSLGERVCVGFMQLGLMSFFPHGLLGVGLGQTMGFRRIAYDAVGGHAALGALALDDTTLARRVRQAGLGCKLVNLSAWVSCRMYASGADAFRGISRSLFPVFHFRALPFVAAYCWLGYVLLYPWLARAPWALALQLGWLALVFGPLRAPATVLAGPLLGPLAPALAIHSWITHARGRTTWKGERVEIKQVKRPRGTGN